MNVNYNLKKIRKSRHMTQKQLARFSGISKSMISAIENEERNPTVPVICAVARALKVTPEELFEYKK